jgi:hypothetical protein
MPPREAGRYNRSMEWGGRGVKPGGEERRGEGEEEERWQKNV